MKVAILYGRLYARINAYINEALSMQRSRFDFVLHTHAHAHRHQVEGRYWNSYAIFDTV